MQEIKKKYVNRRFIIPALLLLGLILLLFIRLFSADGLLLFRGEGVVFETNGFRYGIARNGKNLQFIDKMTGTDYLNADSASYCAYVVKDGKQYPVSAVSLSGDTLTLEFAEAGVRSVVLVNQTNDRARLKVVRVSGNAESLTFINVPLKLEGMPDEPFAACVLSMNISTHVRQLPALQTHLWATAYNRFGIDGAEITLLGLPTKDMLPAIREVMKDARDIPFSDAGGAWAQLSKEGYGSYLMNFGTLTEETVDEWIGMCKNLGFTQIDNHGRSDFFRFGDFELDRKKWPDGWDTFKRINKKLHDAGISSIFQTYAFFIDKNSRYVTPVPREDLGYFSTFTLEKPIGETDSEIEVKEPTDGISLITGFFERNSVTLRIGSELIEFTGVTKTPPYKFTGCKRGALGTKASSHKANTQAYHLREMFNRFVPGVETPLFSEIAKRTAEIVDQAGFDGIYFDAIDGSDILAGPENFWYYGGKFVFETARQLKRPVGMEMSSMIHHWWHYRSRWQAWDRPVRGYKRFVDIHCASIKSDEYEHGLWRGHTPLINKLAPAGNGGLMLPLQLGWWAHQTWNPPQVEATFSDDIEYLACKMIGNNAGLAMLGGFDKKTLDEFPAFKRLNAIIKQYEELRHRHYFNDSIRKLLREPGREFTLFRTPDNEWNFKPVSYQRHKVAGLDHPTANWTVVNEFESQPVKLRIEALMSVKAYDDTANIVLSDFSGEMNFKPEETAAGVTGALKILGEETPGGGVSGTFTATSSGESLREASWVKMEQKFDPHMNLAGNQALGVWVKGDGNGQLVNLRIESPHHISHGARGDHFITIDFTGWKYFELVEIESSEFSNYIWPAPYSSSSFYVYDSYRHQVAFDQVDKLQFWYNNLPAGKTVSTLIGPVKALPLVANTITNPTVAIGEEKICFPVSLESGMYLEFKSLADCKLYGPKGEFIRNVPVQGNIPVLYPGNNEVSFACEPPEGINPRVQVTVIGEGKPLAR
ncbi:carbohydrate binding domain-containing protein [Gaoshiqia sp. Z1-71]|uniref:carbohydrate binding domain-containing protein n=1 Tax=Gaoshiqia hydrogeniformans TaxID=3290090 RepID=UPI003BF7C07B